MTDTTVSEHTQLWSLLLREADGQEPGLQPCPSTVSPRAPGHYRFSLCSSCPISEVGQTACPVFLLVFRHRDNRGERSQEPGAECKHGGRQVAGVANTPTSPQTHTASPSPGQILTSCVTERQRAPSVPHKGSQVPGESP